MQTTKQKAIFFKQKKTKSLLDSREGPVYGYFSVSLGVRCVREIFAVWLIIRSDKSEG